MTLTEADLTRLANLSNPHMKAINEAVTAAYPDHPDEMYTVTLAFQVAVLLSSVSDPEKRSGLLGLANGILGELDYALVPLN